MLSVCLWNAVFQISAAHRASSVPCSARWDERISELRVLHKAAFIQQTDQSGNSHVVVQVLGCKIRIHVSHSMMNNKRFMLNSLHKTFFGCACWGASLIFLLILVTANSDLSDSFPCDVATTNRREVKGCYMFPLRHVKTTKCIFSKRCSCMSGGCITHLGRSAIHPLLPVCACSCLCLVCVIVIGTVGE